MTNEQLLSEIGCIIDQNFNPINGRLTGIDNKLEDIDKHLDIVDKRLGTVDKVEITQETKIIPILSDISEVYTSAFKSYFINSSKIEKLEDDIDI